MIFKYLPKKSVKRRNEPQQFIVNKLLTGGQILADTTEKLVKNKNKNLSSSTSAVQCSVVRSEEQLTV